MVFLRWRQRQGMMQSQSSAFGVHTAVISVMPETKPASVFLSKRKLKLLLTETALSTKRHWSLTKDVVWGFCNCFALWAWKWIRKKKKKAFYWQTNSASSVRLRATHSNKFGLKTRPKCCITRVIYQWSIAYRNVLTNNEKKSASFGIAHTQILWAGQSVPWWSTEAPFQKADFQDSRGPLIYCMGIIFFLNPSLCRTHEKLYLTFTDYFWGNPWCVDEKWHCYWWYSVPGRTLLR